ncbi:hypothetical protein [Pseudomonas sp. RA_105y_Pfl2_P56]|uniref:hypothetical protein n=1 Tax=Pseudomonas sp. RA_105y_Pfl2_P56 TaxID=3088701 RepID=UPI0030DB5361
MAEYVFTVKLPAARSGGTPDCDKWTFHHVLPWKYFYCLGSLLGYYQTAVILNYSQLTGGPPDVANRTTLNTKFKDIVQCNNEITLVKSLLGMVEAQRLLNGLTRTSNGVADRLATETVSANISKLFVECTSPVFGGFPGMEGKQRNDDPESTMEKNRPFNGNATWWAALQAIGAKLELSSYWAPNERNGCKDIKSAGYGDKVKFKLTDAHFNDEIFAHLRTLVTPGFNTTVLPFDAKSWLSHYNGSTWSFNITDNQFQVPEYGADLSGLRFSVSTINSHAGRKKHVAFTRCPTINNEMNQLRPTKETLKTLNNHA